MGAEVVSKSKRSPRGGGGVAERKEKAQDPEIDGVSLGPRVNHSRKKERPRERAKCNLRRSRGNIKECNKLEKEKGANFSLPKESVVLARRKQPKIFKPKEKFSVHTGREITKWGNAKITLGEEYQEKT